MITYRGHSVGRYIALAIMVWMAYMAYGFVETTKGHLQERYGALEQVEQESGL